MAEQMDTVNHLLWGRSCGPRLPERPRRGRRWSYKVKVAAEYQDGLSLYLFVRANPIVYRDWDGRVVPPIVLAAIKAFIIAEAACITASGLSSAWYTSDSANDKYRHCHASCVIARNCGRMAAWMVGYLRELSDELKEWLGLAPEGFDWADILANAGGRACAGWLGPLNYIFSESCKCCCSKKHKP